MRYRSAVWSLKHSPTDGGCPPLAPRRVMLGEADGDPLGLMRANVESTPQSLVTPEGYALVWDGRLDNREELSLELAHAPSAGASDGDLVMAFCRRQGLRRTLPRLIGDWALSFWDAHTRRLSLARDYAGVRPLYYHVGPQGCWWSLDLEALLSAVGRPRPLDRPYVAGLFFLGPDPSATPYEGIE